MTTDKANKFSLSLDKTNFEIRTYVQVDTFADEWRSLVEDKVSVITSLAQLYSGLVTPSTLPPDTLSDLLSKLNNSQPLFKNPLEYFPFLTAEVYRGFTIIRVPLYPSSGMLYQLTKVTPLPSIQNVGIFVPDQPIFYYVQLVSSFSTLQEDQKYITANELNSCTNKRRVYICDNLNNLFLLKAVFTNKNIFLIQIRDHIKNLNKNF